MDSSSLRDAYACLKDNRPEAARPILRAFLEKHPDSAPGWFLMSQALPDKDQQIDCLQRALALNPQFEEAQTRLAELTAVPEKDPPEPGPAIDESGPPVGESQEVQATPPFTHPIDFQPAVSEKENEVQPEPSADPPSIVPDRREQRSVAQAVAQQQASKDRTPWLVIALLAVGAVSVIGLSLLVVFSLSASTRLPTQEPQNLAVASTRIAQELPPTWTATPPPTAVLTPTPSPSPTLAPPAPEIAADMEIIQQQVIALRGLESQGEVPRYLIPVDQVREKLEEIATTGSKDLKAETADQVRVLAALGLVKPTYDLYTKMLNDQGDSLGGFYVPWTKELFVIGEEYGSLERFVYSHEYDHALVDQHFNLDQLGVYPECTGEYQHCEAVRALVEGDATLLMFQWMEAHTSEAEQEEIFRFEPPTEIISSADFAPPFVVREVSFWYDDGAAFVEYLYDRGGWPQVDRAYGELPQTTEQILHPEKYLSGEVPISIGPVALRGVLGDGWRLLESETMGELTTAMVLGYGIDAISQLDPETTAAAAAGWGGDNYQVYYRGSTNATVLTAHWIWDSMGDADEFRQALSEYLNRIYVGNRYDYPQGSCWHLLNQEISCIFTQDLQTLWLKVPDQKILDAVKGEYPDFG